MSYDSRPVANEPLYVLARENVEKSTGKPAYLSSDEEWYVAVEEARIKLGITEQAPVCPYCGSVAPYGDERHMWIDAHYNIFHKLYHNKIKKRFSTKKRKTSGSDTGTR